MLYHPMNSMTVLGCGSRNDKEMVGSRTIKPSKDTSINTRSVNLGNRSGEINFG